MARRGIGRMRAGGSSPVTALFSSGEQGFYLNAYEATSLFQDSAGTTPVAASGDSVGMMRDLSPNGNHFTQATAGSRPTYLVEGSLRAIRADGTAQFLERATLNMSGSTAATLIACFRQNRNTPLGAIFVHGTTTANSNGLLENNGGLGVLHGIVGASSLNFQQNRSIFDVTVPNMRTVTVKFNPAEAVQADRVKVRVGGYLVDTTVTSSAGTISSATFDSDAASIFKVSTNFSNCDLFALVYIGRLLSDSEIRRAEQFFSSRELDTQAYGLVSFDDSRPVMDQHDYVQTTPLASVTYSTTATSVDVSGFVSDGFFTSHPTLAKVGILVDGVYNQQLSPADGAFTITATLPAGSKQVTFVNGPARRTAEVRHGGAYLTGLSFNAAATRVDKPVTSRMVIYGDSITTGQAADPVHQFAWTVQLRKLRGSASTVIEGIGGLALFHDASTANYRARLVGMFESLVPSKIYLAIGTNDYGLNLWTAANFGTAFAALLDDLHTILPNALIWCQSPIPRSVETANGLGSTLTDYRTQISTATSARSSYCTFVDGTAIVTTGDLSDGLHPTTAGHTKYYDYVKVLPGLV